MEFRTHLAAPAARFDDLDAAVEWCARWVDLRAAVTPRDQRLAAIFDVDYTLVADDRRIEPVVNLFDTCKALHITPFLITARSERGREYTEDQLRRLRISGQKRLLMHPENVRISHAGRQKLLHRERVTAHGYTVCLNAGDALHDHVHPVPESVRSDARHDGDCAVFVTSDGVAHLKLPG